MDLSPTTFVTIDACAVQVSASSAREAKLALKELRLKKREYGLLKRLTRQQMKAIRAGYTRDVRTRGSMMRGGGGLGRIVRAFQSVSRDNRRSKLASDLAPLEASLHHIEATIHAIEEAMVRVESELLRA